MPTNPSTADQTIPDWQSTAEALAKIIPFDEQLYSLEGEELAFIKAQTGIEDEDELKQHIISITKEAYDVFPFPCIRRFAFIGLRLARLPGYDQLIKLGKEREGAILVDIGCCFGNDVRSAVADGFPAKQIVTSDLHGEFWALGHKLFRSTPESFPAKFLPGDAFDPALLAVVPPVYDTKPELAPELATLTSLNPLHGHVAAVHAFAFFHLFNEEPQAHLARAMAGLLSPLPGSMLIGCQRGAPQKGFWTEGAGGASGSMTMFCHSPESWAELWDGQVFRKGTVKVETNLVELPVGLGDEMVYFLEWCITRL